ncbi:MAG: hypothetical protein ACREVL_05040 [Solimonas sp.]
MRAFRPFVHVVVALLFLVQGVAVAATRQALPQPVMHEPAVAMMAMPCHDSPEQMSAARHGGSGKSACCNEACPDLLSCALSAAAAPAVAGFVPLAVPPALIGFASGVARPALPGATFRPPIPSLSA